nr:MAG TPA: hypothetical protein [Caudoviricetes sp.]
MNPYISAPKNLLYFSLLFSFRFAHSLRSFIKILQKRNM